MNTMNVISKFYDIENSRFCSLIEFPAVLVIISILIFLALLCYRPYLYKTEVAEGYEMVRSFQVEAQLFYAHYGNWLVSDTANDVSKYIQNMQLQNGAITIRYRNIKGLSTDNALSFRPAVKNDPEPPVTVIWSCGYALPKAGFTPHGENQTTVSPDYLTSVCR